VRLRVKGNATPVSATRGPFSVSDNGLLVYSERPRFQLAWLDRSGRELETLAIRGDFYAPKLSHDGRRVALSSFDERGIAAGDIWVYDLDRSVGTRITTDPANDKRPLWSPDDEWIVFSSDRTGRSNVYRKRSTGVGRDEPLLASDFDSDAVSWSRDGGVLIVGDSRQDLWQVSLPGGKATRLMETPFRESDAQISPNGKWIAYSSDETGQAEIYVQPFPPSGARWRISTGSGVDPKWRGDGKELFYTDTSRKLMSVDLTLEPSVKVGAPSLLLDAATLRDTAFYYDVSADGQRFLVVKPAADAATRPITIVQNWMANLKK
jgi:eukaryotic-like serine/threonine-protein kinase